MLDDVLSLLEDSDTFALIEHLHSSGDPSTISSRYAELANDLYWKAKNLSAAIAVSRAGIQHNLISSLPPCPPDMAYRLRSNAKALAYNLGSFTWDGWNEEGIIITSSDLAVGRDAAALNLRLAVELEKPAKALANAHWLIGAHALSTKDFNQALEHFAESARVSEDPLTPLMNRGYIALAHILAHRDLDANRVAFDQSTTDLRQSGGEDGPFLADQLVSVRGYFEK